MNTNTEEMTELEDNTVLLEEESESNLEEMEEAEQDNKSPFGFIQTNEAMQELELAMFEDMMDKPIATIKPPKETYQQAEKWAPPKSFIEEEDMSEESLDQAKMTKLEARRYKTTEVMMRMMFDIVFGEKGKGMIEKWDQCNARRDASG